MNNKSQKIKSELRQDLVSGDWIIIAPSRAARPHSFTKFKKRKKDPISNCPFENPQKSGHKDPILIYSSFTDTMVDINNWIVQVIENKFPALQHTKNCSIASKHGPYSLVSGVGYHDLIITRNHDKDFSRLNKNEANLVFQAFRDRYLMIYNDKCLSYISIFHNWGLSAGASIYHPHYQLIAIPVVPPDVNHSLIGSARYFKKYKKCVHCVMIEQEIKEKRRIIFENEGAIAFCPYVSREPFEIRVSPKKHLPFFENTLDCDMEFVVEALRESLKRIRRRLGDPDYNFFIHTAPLKDKENYKHYHWHIEIYPKFSITGGFELSTGVEINIVDPDEAAKILKHV